MARTSWGRRRRSARRRRTLLVLGLLIVGLLVVGLLGGSLLFTAWAPSRLLGRGRAGPALGTLSVVALGDSVPAGHGCGCDPFPVLYGRWLARRTAKPVTVHDEGRDGQDTTGLLDELHEERVGTEVAGATVVLVTIGANDFLDHRDDVTQGTCSRGSPRVDCVSEELSAMRRRLGQVLDRVSRLRGGRPTTVLVTGYWNVFQDGHVGNEAYGTEGLQASIALTERVDEAISAVTAAAGATYVDLFAPFQARGSGITALLVADGDHPSAAGHRLIATLLGQAQPVPDPGVAASA